MAGGRSGRRDAAVALTRLCALTVIFVTAGLGLGAAPAFAAEEVSEPVVVVPLLTKALERCRARVAAIEAGKAPWTEAKGRLVTHLAARKLVDLAGPHGWEHDRDVRVREEADHHPGHADRDQDEAGEPEGARVGPALRGEAVGEETEAEHAPRDARDPEREGAPRQLEAPRAATY